VGLLWRLLTLTQLRNVSVRFRMKVTRFIHANAARNGVEALSYPGPIALFRSAYQEWDRLNMPEDLGWSEFCGKVSVWRVPGDHWSLMAEANVASTAKAVIEALHESAAPAATSAGPGKPAKNAEVRLPVAEGLLFDPAQLNGQPLNANG
jgi:hypothetical protein